MKNTLKKVMAVGMVFALLVGVLAMPVQKAKAAKLYIFNLDLSIVPSSFGESQYIGTRGSLGYEPIEIEKNKAVRLLGPGEFKSFSKFCKVKSMSVKSSNSKIFKVTGKKAKAVKNGTAKLTFKIVWTHTGKSGKLEYPVYKKCKTKKDKDNYGDYRVVAKKKSVKKGKTYTYKVTLPYAVVCKKHKYSGAWKVTKKPTCAEKGIKQRKCKKCSHEEWKLIAKSAHKWGEWKVTKEATATQAGEAERVCSVCKAKEKRVQ